MATKTKAKRKSSRKPARKTAANRLGSAFGRPQAEQMQAFKQKWLKHAITEKLNAEPGFSSSVARDLGIELTSQFYTAPILDLFSKAQLFALAGASGVEVSPRSTKEKLIGSLLADREKLVIPQEVEQL